MPAATGENSGLSIVIPAYNEASRLEPGLKSLTDYLGRSGRVAEIVLVDDGSTDGTADLAGRFLRGAGVEHRVLSGRPNRGKGYSVREGALAARQPWTLVTDADLSTPIGEVERLLATARASGYDVVVGSRALAMSRIGVRQTWIREMMGRCFNVLVRLLTGIRLRDTQCGFKLWRTEGLRPVLSILTVDGFAWDVEFLLAARKAGLSIGECAVEWNDVRGSKVGMLRDSVRMLQDLVRIRLRHSK